MYQDEIISEVWRNRDAYVEEHHHSLAEIVADLKRRQEDHRGRLVDWRSHDHPKPQPRRSASA